MERDSDAMFLGTVLRRARIAAGISSQDELAERLGYERTVIAKAESGQRPPSPDVARAYAHEFPQFNALIDNGLIEEWSEHVRRNGGSFPQFFVDWVDAEKNAATLFYWAPILVPGILQVESYAHTILTTEPDETESADVLLAGRLERRRVLARPQPPAVTVVMAEAVLHRGVGGPAVMYEQLTHLADVSQRPKVMIQVIPAEIGAHAGLAGAVSIADREGRPTVVHLDSFTAGQTTEAPEIVAKVRQISDMLRCEALPRGASQELIMKVAKEKWTP
ncbi:MAG: helix-turn-helix transcriptional regulator [Streptosporangiaceae bacterium]|jgi:transcriptional regulator with XRE-family HTH domain